MRVWEALFWRFMQGNVSREAIDKNFIGYNVSLRCFMLSLLTKKPFEAMLFVGLHSGLCIATSHCRYSYSYEMRTILCKYSTFKYIDRNVLYVASSDDSQLKPYCMLTAQSSIQENMAARAFQRHLSW